MTQTSRTWLRLLQLGLTALTMLAALGWPALARGSA
jgi:hypothetical protein